MPPLLADFIYNRVCKLKCEKFLTRPKTNRMGEKCSCCFDAFSVSAFVSKQKTCSGLIAGAGFSTG